MDGRPTWTGCDEAGDYVVPNVLSPRDLVFRPDNMDETVPHTRHKNTYFHMGKQRLRSANAPLLSVLSGTQYSEVHVVCFGD